MKKSSMTEAVVRGVCRHPYLWAGIVCLAVDPFFLGSVGNIPNNALLIESLLVIAAVALFGVCKYRRGDIDRVSLWVFLGCALFADYNLLQQYSVSENKPLWHFAGGCAALLILYILADREGRFKEQLGAMLIMGLGFCLKLYYIIVTSVYTRQYNIDSFDVESGQAGYIEYLVNHRQLPDFDLRERWQFTQPPLHHMISALWVHINENLLGVGRDPARESVQTLPLFYSMCIMIAAYKILRYFGLKGKSLYIPLLIVNFHPAFILLSGSINNDTLWVALVMAAAAATLEWYREQTLQRMIPVAVCVGCALMTSISAALIALPVALVFLSALMKAGGKKKKGRRKELLRQLVCFCVICLPLGLWFLVRGYYKWGIPFGYSGEITAGSMQYLGDRSFGERIRDFSSYQWASPFQQWAYYDDDGALQGYNEFNPIISMLKTSLFGAYINEGTFATRFGVNTATILFWVNLLIAVFALVAMAAVCIKRLSVEKAFLASFYVMLMGSFFIKASKYPYTAALDFRFITPTVIIGAVFMGLAFKELHKNKKWGDSVADVLGECTLIFALGASALYLSLT